MKRTCTAIGILVAVSLLAPVAIAQMTVHDEIALSRAQIQAERQAIVTATLDLTEAEAKVFWPLYRDYRAEVDKPIDRAWAIEAVRTMIAGAN